MGPLFGIEKIIVKFAKGASEVKKKYGGFEGNGDENGSNASSF